MDECNDPEISPSDCCGTEQPFDEQKWIKIHKLFWEISRNGHINLGTTRISRVVKSYCETAATEQENISRQVSPLCASKITLQNPIVTDQVSVPPDVVKSTEPNTQLSPRSPDVLTPVLGEMAESQSPESFDWNPASRTTEETPQQATEEKRCSASEGVQQLNREDSESVGVQRLNREDSSYNSDLAASMNSSTTGRNSSQSSLVSNDEGLSRLAAGTDEDTVDGTGIHVEKHIPGSQHPDSCPGPDSIVTHDSNSSTSTLIVLSTNCNNVCEGPVADGKSDVCCSRFQDPLSPGATEVLPVAGGIEHTVATTSTQTAGEVGPHQTRIHGYYLVPEDNESVFFDLPPVVPLQLNDVAAANDIGQSQMQAGIMELEDRFRLLLLQSLVNQNLDAVTLETYINLLSQTLTPSATGIVVHGDPVQVAYGHSQDSDWTEDQQTDCIRNLEIANSCTDGACSDDNCSFWKEMIEDIEFSVRNNCVNNLQRRILNVVADHAADCSEIFCGVPWCFFYTHCDRPDRQQQHAALRNFYHAIDVGSEMNLMTQNYGHHPGPDAAAAAAGDEDDEDEQAVFLQINRQVEWPSVMFEYDHPYPVVQLDFNLHYVSLIKQGRVTSHGQSYTIPPRQLLIEQYTLMEGSVSVEMWRSLREAGGQHENIVGHFWCLLTPPIVKVCLDRSHVFEGGNLQNCLRQQGRTYPWPVICRYVRGLVSATQFLHDAGVLFLRWTASSIYVSADNRRAMLGDLSCAIHLRSILEDRDAIDVVKYCLPPHIIPPELFNGELDVSSDVWGIGCLLYEVVNNGLPLHYQHRHLPRDELRDYVENFDVNSFQHTMRNNLLRQIFVVANSRMTLNHVAAYLEERMERDLI